VHNGLRRSILSATYSTPALVLGKSTSPTAGQRKELDIERIKSEYLWTTQILRNPHTWHGEWAHLGSQSLRGYCSGRLGRHFCNLVAQNPSRRRESDSTETGTFTAGRESLRGAPGADSTPLEVHHKSFRSQSREGTEQNLITLCFDCHAHAHHRTEYLRRSRSERPLD